MVPSHIEDEYLFIPLTELRVYVNNENKPIKFLKIMLRCNQSFSM